MTAIPKPRSSSRTPNMRGAVPAPKEKPRIPCRSLDAHRAKAATAMRTIPPTKSCGQRIHFGMMELTGPWLGVSLIDLSPHSFLTALIG